MLQIKLHCLYCGNLWSDYVYSLDSNIDHRFMCPRCKERKLVEKYESKDVFGYDYQPKVHDNGNGGSNGTDNPFSD